MASTRNVVEAKLTLSKEGIAIIPPMPGRRGYLTIRNKDGLHVALKSVDFSNGKTVVVNLAKPLLVDLMVTSKATGKPPRQQYLLVGAPGHAATYVFFGGPDRKRDLRVALDSGSSLSGRVLRPDGKAATGAQLLIVTMVRAAGNPGGHWGVPPIPVTCGKDGRFEFHGLTRRNNFHVLALTPGLGLSKQMTNPVHWLLAHAPATDEKTDLGDLELARLSKLELRVQHADGSPATAARVHQHDRRLSVWIDHVVDSRGKLSMLCPATELAFGAYELRGGVGLARWTLGQGAQTRVLRLSQPVTVFGTVVAATGEPVAGAWVRLWNRPIGPSFALKGLCFKQQDYQVKTDVKGEFQLEAAGVEGDYRLRAGSSSKGKWTISAEIPFTIDPQRPRVPQLEVKLPEPSATDPSNK